MKPFFILVSMVIGALAQEAAAAEIHSVWNCSGARRSTKILGVLKNDEYNSDYWLTLSDSDGAGAEEWRTDRNYLPTQVGTKTGGANSRSTITVEIKKKDEEVSVQVKQHEGGSARYRCSRDKSEESADAVETAVAGFERKWEAIDAITTPRTLSEFKAMLRLVRRRVGTSGGEAAEQLPLHVPDLTIELSWDETPSDAELKTASISAIAKRLKIKKWDKEEDVLHGEDNADGKVYRFYRENSEAFTQKPFSRGAAKFVRYEIVEASTFACEDFYVEHESYVWVLVDGSTFRYSPGLECD